MPLSNDDEPKTKPAPASIEKKLHVFHAIPSLSIGAQAAFFMKSTTVKVEDVVNLTNDADKVYGQAVVTAIITDRWDAVKAFASDTLTHKNFPPFEAQNLLFDTLDIDVAKDKITVLFLKRTA